MLSFTNVFVVDIRKHCLKQCQRKLLMMLALFSMIALVLERKVKSISSVLIRNFSNWAKLLNLHQL